MNQNILYLECNSGISGDMTVGALLDLGADRHALETGLASLPLTGYSIQISEVFKSGLRACDFNVILDPEHENHDHDMAYLHGSGDAHGADAHAHVHTHTGKHAHTHAHTDGHEHTHVYTDGHEHTHVYTDGHEHTHTHDHAEAHGHAHHHHDARNLHDITEILNRSDMTPHAKELAIRIFTVLARAEASVHGKSIDEVHFHEVGAVDSIVDIAAAAICIDSLQPDEIVVSPLTDGTGTIRCQHGIIPVPVPAVSAILSAHGLPLKIRQVEGELVTPTGAAIAAALRTKDSLPEEFRILRTGLGAGKRDYAVTGVLRAMLLQPVEKTQEEAVLMLETNIDDCTGETLAFTLELLMESGALDAYYTPVYMKKNRPAWLLTVLCAESKRQDMEKIIFRHTTTIGIRTVRTDRTRLARKIITVETPWGPADVKLAFFEAETYCYPEHDSVQKLAQKADISFSEMYHRIKEIAQKE